MDIRAQGPEIHAEIATDSAWRDILPVREMEERLDQEEDWNAPKFKT